MVELLCSPGRNGLPAILKAGRERRPSGRRSVPEDGRGGLEAVVSQHQRNDEGFLATKQQAKNSKAATSISARFPNPKRANSVEDAAFSFPSFLHELFLLGRRKRSDEATTKYNLR